jgi:hypothetical protein
MVPPIAAIAFIRLLCGVRSADVALCKRCMQCKMEPSERDRDNETCKRYGGARLWGISSVFLLRYHSIISLVGRKYDSLVFFCNFFRVNEAGNFLFWRDITDMWLG